MRVERKIKIEKGSLLIVILMGIVPFLIAALQKFNIWNISNSMASILVLLGSGFVLNEQIRKHGKNIFKDTGSVVLVGLISLAVIGALLSLANVQIPAFETIQGAELVVVLVAVLIEFKN